MSFIPILKTSCISNFADSHETALAKPDIEKKINQISDWVEKQKRGSDEKSKKELVQNVGKVVTATASGVQKLQSGKLVTGTLEIISGVATFAGELIGGPAGAVVGAVIGTLCSISLQTQTAKHCGTTGRRCTQRAGRLQQKTARREIQRPKTACGRSGNPGDNLDDPNLWNDFVQFWVSCPRDLSHHCRLSMTPKRLLPKTQT